MSITAWQDFPHVLETQQFQAEHLERIVQHALNIEKVLRRGFQPKLDDERYQYLISGRPYGGKVLLLLFYEPSTRTYKTFWDAGRLLGFDMPSIIDPQTFSSFAKGEDELDAIAAYTQVGGMGQLRGADCVVVRHPKEGFPVDVANVVMTACQDGESRPPLPVINAGDGTNQHPTQSLMDLATIYAERNTWCENHPLQDLQIVVSGDLKYGRTVNSLLHLLGRFGAEHHIHVIFSAHPAVGPKEGILEYLGRHSVSWENEPDFEKAIRRADVIYLTRIQKERMPDLELYNQVKGQYVFRLSHLECIGKRAIIMHPLPIDRRNPPAEIEPSLTYIALQGDPRCAWLRQSHRGYPVRAALLDIIFQQIEATPSAS